MKDLRPENNSTLLHPFIAWQIQDSKESLVRLFSNILKVIFSKGRVTPRLGEACDGLIGKAIDVHNRVTSKLRGDLRLNIPCGNGQLVAFFKNHFRGENLEGEKEERAGLMQTAGSSKKLHAASSKDMLMKSCVPVKSLCLKFTSCLAFIYISAIPAVLLAYRLSDNAVTYLSFIILILIG